MLQNIGSVRNQGFEFALNTVNIETKNIRWTTSANFSRNINKILSLGAVSYQFTGNVSTSLYPSGGNSSGILQVGQPIGSFYGYVFGGIWQSASDIAKSGTKQSVKPGDPIYKDLNGDSSLTALGDKAIIGHALPKFTYGFTSNLTVGRFNLFVLIQGVYGVNILNENKIETENGTTTDNKLAYVATDSWTAAGTSNRLWPREPHSGRWLTNYVPRAFDSMLFRSRTGPQRGLWPWEILRGFGRCDNLDLADRGHAFLAARRAAGMARAKYLTLKLAIPMLRAFGIWAGLLIPSISIH